MNAKFAALLMLLLLVARAGATDVSPATLPATLPAKLWVTDLPSVLNANPRNHLIVGRSNQPALSADEAETMARRDAAGQIAQSMIGNANRANAAIWIDSSIRRGDWIVDRQIESTVRPYGTIWRAALLINADPRELDGLVHQMQDAQNQQRTHRTAAVAISVVWLMAISMVYTLINWLTRGYFRGRLALVSVVLAAAGVFGVAQTLWRV
jgi:hypothetical protein